MYLKYRYAYYFWECIILLEAFVATVLLVMLQTQNNPALQVLMAMVVIFLETTLHVSLHGRRPRVLQLRAESLSLGKACSLHVGT